MQKTSEDYFILKEIVSLFSSINESRKKIEGHKSRLELASKEKTKAQQSLISKKEEREFAQTNYNSFTDLLDRIEIRFAKLQEQNGHSYAVQLEKELKDLEIKKEETYEKSFLLLEKLELLDKEIQKLQNFISGFESSFTEISNEVETNIAQEKKSIFSYEKRIHNNVESMPDELQNLYLIAKKKNIIPLAYVINDSCKACGAIISRAIQLDLDTLKKWLNCPICKRILIPSHVH